MNVKELVKRSDNGENFDYHYFWGGFCSQWADSQFVLGGITYQTCEQYMMAEKARLFDDGIALTSILESNDPRENKAVGRQIKNFDFEQWDEVKYQIVVRGNMAKFRQNPDLLRLLLKTGDKILVEASAFDKVWGIGMDEGNPEIGDPTNWNGQNLLGFAIMDVRDVLAG